MCELENPHHQTMAFTHRLSPPLNLSPTKFPKLPFKHCQILHLARRRFSLNASILSSDRQQEILEAVAESNGKLLPVVRTYENDSARLSLIGAVDFQQALTAAAADGGRAAEEHLEAGIPAMVVETVFPGPPDENSTVSTRLFLPARKVKEKAKTIKRSVGGDIFSNATSQNILAMTFRQVVLHQLWSFELVVFSPGATRDMDNLEDPREVPASCAISSSDEMVISSLAEVICLSALENTDMQFYSRSFGRGLTKLFPWFRKPRKIVSKDFSVILEKVLENEIVANSKALLEKFVQEREKFRSTKGKSRDNWWTLSSFSELEKIGGPEFIAWIREFVPVYRLQVDGSKLETVKFDGGNLLTENYWEIFLTHSQMVSLADVLDMYYEDSFTLPGKRLPCGVTVKLSNLQKNKGNSPLRIFSYVLASGLFLLAISIFSKFQMPHLPSWRQHPQKDTSLQTSTRCVPLKALESDKLDALCISIITRIKEYFHWPEEVKTEKGCFAWTGDLPLYLRRMAEIDSGFSDVSSAPTLAEERLAGMKESAQDIASYNVVLSTDGRLVGFQPTTQVAVNHWSSNPLAKELHGGRKLSPGFIEPRLKMIRPDEVVVFELLMSVNPESRFALVRPLKNAEMDVQ